MVWVQNMLGAQTRPFGGVRATLTPLPGLWDHQLGRHSALRSRADRSILTVPGAPTTQNHHHWASRLTTQSTTLIRALRMTPAELRCEHVSDLSPWKQHLTPVGKPERVWTLNFVLCMFSFPIQLCSLSLLCIVHTTNHMPNKVTTEMKSQTMNATLALRKHGDVLSRLMKTLKVKELTFPKTIDLEYDRTREPQSIDPFSIVILTIDCHLPNININNFSGT